MVAWCTDRVVAGEGREGYSPTWPCSGGLSYFNYRINFDWDISRQGVYADRSAGMTTSFSEHFYHKIRRTIDHLWMVLKVRFSIYEAAESNHAHNLTKIAIQRLLQLCKDIDGTQPGSSLPFLDGESRPKFSREFILAAFAGHLSGYVNLIALPARRHIVCGRRRCRGQSDPQTHQVFFQQRSFGFLSARGISV